MIVFLVADSQTTPPVRVEWYVEHVAL